MVAVPVLLGSLMRIPLGWLTDRLGGRRVFTALMVFTPLPLIALALLHDSLGAILAFGFLLGFAGASFAVGVPFVNGWYPPERQGFALGIYGMGMGGTVLAGLTAPRIVDHWGLAAPFWVAAGLMVAMAGVFLALARDAPRPPRSRSSARHVRRSLGLPHQRPGLGADALLLPGLRRLRRHVPLPAQAAHRRARPHQGRRRRPRRRLRAARRHRPARRAAGCRTASARRAFCSSRSSGSPCSPRCSPSTYTSMVPLTIVCLTMAVALGLGTGAVFKLVPEWFPDRVGAVTGVVGAAGGLGGFFPPLVMGIVKSATGGYALGFILMALVAVGCLFVLGALRGPAPTAPSQRTVPTSP